MITWRNSEQLEGDLVEAVTGLKNEPGATYRDERIGLRGSSVAGRQSPGRTALAGRSDRCPQGQAAPYSTRSPCCRGWSTPRLSAPSVLHQ
jgi:hypothetical protein